MNNEFWVVGGRYSDTGFQSLLDGTAEAYGPFNDYDDAYRQWAERSNGSRSLASVRYSIVVTAPCARAA